MRRGAILLLGMALATAPALAYQPSARYAAEPGSLGIAYTDVRFVSTRDSVTLNGWWFAGRDSSPVMVVCPPETGNMADKLASAREWVARGFSVMTFDLRDAGPASAGDVDSLHAVIFSSRWVNDVEGALRFARTRAAGRPVLGWGQDMGGVLLFAAAARQRGNADAIATEGLFRTSQEQLLWLGTSQDPDVTRRHRILVAAADEPISSAFRMHTPLFVVIAGKDDVTPPDITRQVIAHVAAPRETWLLPDAGHAHLDATPGYFDHVVAGLSAALGPGRLRLPAR